MSAGFLFIGFTKSFLGSVLALSRIVFSSMVTLSLDTTISRASLFNIKTRWSSTTVSVGQVILFEEEFSNHLSIGIKEVSFVHLCFDRKL